MKTETRDKPLRNDAENPHKDTVATPLDIFRPSRRFLRMNLQDRLTWIVDISLAND